MDSDSFRAPRRAYSDTRRAADEKDRPYEKAYLREREGRKGRKYFVRQGGAKRTEHGTDQSSIVRLKYGSVDSERYIERSRDGRPALELLVHCEREKQRDGGDSGERSL